MALWDRISSKGTIDDRRGLGGAGVLGGGIGIAGIIIAIALNYFGVAVNPSEVTNILGQFSQDTTALELEQPDEFRGNDSYEQFTATVLGSTNDTWNSLFSENKAAYEEPKLVLFRGSTRSACGGAYSQVGPHYCPADRTIYLDETFFEELKQLGGNDSDAAQAYVIAHEVGHHVQNLTGGLRGGVTGNSQSVRTELQADCYAGVWAYSVRKLGVFEDADITKVLSAAAAVGDDRIQQRTGQQVQSETWTHGSSEQRISAFSEGYTSGAPAQCSF